MDILRRGLQKTTLRHQGKSPRIDIEVGPTPAQSAEQAASEGNCFKNTNGVNLDRVIARHDPLGWIIP